MLSQLIKLFNYLMGAIMKILSTIIMLVFLLCVSHTVYAQDKEFKTVELDIQWDANPPSDQVVGYKVYKSKVSGGPYELEADVGNVTVYTMTEKFPIGKDTVVYITVTAYDEYLESDYSNEASHREDISRPNLPSNLIILDVRLVVELDISPSGNALADEVDSNK